MKYGKRTKASVILPRVAGAFFIAVDAEVGTQHRARS